MIVANTDTIRDHLVDLYIDQQFVTDKHGGLLVEIAGASFLADSSAIIGKPNRDYVERELAWYESMSRYVQDIPGQTPKVWEDVADRHGRINSNYGWCIWSEENGSQYANVVQTLAHDQQSRQAIMIYNRPSMHRDAKLDGMSDFMCTNAVQYLVRDGAVHAVVQMRSNDVVFGYRNDWAWQDHVLGLQRCGRAVGANVVDDQLVVHAGCAHGHNVVHRSGPGGELASELLLDHRPILGLDLVELTADGRSGQRADAGPDRCTGAGVSDRVADNGSRAGPQ